MKEIRNNIIKRTVLWMSMFSVLLYSTRVCGITNLIAQAAEKDAPESDFVIEENDNIQNTSKKDNYIVVTDDSKTAKVIEKKDMVATVEVEGIRRDISLMLLPEANEGDYILMHAGFAIQVIDEEEAKITTELLKEVLGTNEPASERNETDSSILA